MDKLMRDRPIGVFDSGLGGLTVVRELRKVMPFEDIIYFGDTARLPYGSKSKRLITRYSLENAIFLNSKNVKMIVIACNTASAACSEFLQSFLNLPIVGVVECGASVAAKVTKNKRVGVIGTKSTMKSGAYCRAVKRFDPEIEVFELATPLLVHLVEEDWVEREISKQILEEYLTVLFREDIDTLILGCTHYPLLKKQISAITSKIVLVDSSEEIARQIFYKLNSEDMLSTNERVGDTTVFLSDAHPEFSKWSKDVLGVEVKANSVDLETHGF